MRHSNIHTSPARDAHPYTRSKTPWVLEENRLAKGETSDGKKFGWRLFHYIAGGGMMAFGRTVKQDEVALRQSRFLAICAVLAAVWTVFWIF